MKKIFILMVGVFMLFGCEQQVQMHETELAGLETEKKVEEMIADENEVSIGDEIVNKEDKVKEKIKSTQQQYYLKIKEWNIKMPVVVKNDLSYRIIDDKSLKIYSKELSGFSKKCSNEELYIVSKNKGSMSKNYGDGSMKQFSDFHIATSMPPICDELNKKEKDIFSQVLKNFNYSFENSVELFEENMINKDDIKIDSVGKKLEFTEKYCIKDICFAYPKGWYINDGIDMEERSGIAFFSIIDKKTGKGDYSKPYIFINSYSLKGCPDGKQMGNCSINETIDLNSKQKKNELYENFKNTGRIVKEYKNKPLPKLKIDALHLDLNEYDVSPLYLFNSDKGVFTVTYNNLGKDNLYIMDDFFDNIIKK